MKIGIDAHNLEGRPGGVSSYLASLIDEWNKFDLPEDLKFILYFSKKIPEKLNHLRSCFEKKVLPVFLGRRSDTLFRHWLLPKAAKEDQVDILFCPGYVAPVFYNRPVALAVHDIIYEARPDLYNWQYFGERILLKYFSKISIKKARVVFVPSQFTKDEVLKHYNINSGKIFKIPLAADGFFKPMENEGEVGAIKEKYHIKDKFILYLGSIFNRRHLPEIIAAFQKVAQKLAGYQLLIVGENHTAPFIDIDNLIEQVNKILGREAILHLQCPYKDQALIYNAADLFIYLSDYEGFGLPVLEAMACGTPVVTSQSSSLFEVAGEAAIYVRNNSNIEEISASIFKGLGDENLRQKLKKESLVQAERFSWQKSARETLRIVTGKTL